MLTVSLPSSVGSGPPKTRVVPVRYSSMTCRTGRARLHFLCLERQLVAIGFTSVPQSLPALLPYGRDTGEERDVIIVSRIFPSRHGDSRLMNFRDQIYIFSLWRRGRRRFLEDT